MSEPNTITTRRTHVNGQEILAIEQATGPHPRWTDRVVPYAGVSKALLADGTEVWLCDGDGKTPCSHVGDSTRSVVAHRNGTHNRTMPRHSVYPEATIRRLVIEIEKAKRAKMRGYADAAAKALNEAGIPTVHGGPWTPSGVSGLYNAWGKAVRVRLPRDPAEARANSRRAKVADTLEAVDLHVLREFVGALPRLASALDRLIQSAERGADPVVADKARRWDEMQQLLKGAQTG